MVGTEKTEDDMEREAQLLEWRLTLTEERNAVMVPSAGSGIPGAPAEWYVTWQDLGFFYLHCFFYLFAELTLTILHIFIKVCIAYLFTGFLSQAWRLIFLLSS